MKNALQAKSSKEIRVLVFHWCSTG